MSISDTYLYNDIKIDLASSKKPEQIFISKSSAFKTIGRITFYSGNGLLDMTNKTIRIYYCLPTGEKGTFYADKENTTGVTIVNLSRSNLILELGTVILEFVISGMGNDGKMTFRSSPLYLKITP